MNWYRTHHRHTKESTVWLNLGDREAREIADEYGAMRKTHENEAAYSHFAKLHFFKQDPYRMTTGDTSCNTALFKLE